MTYNKPYNISYTDMCIWVDQNVYTDDCDVNTLYEYLYHIVNMLAHEGRYFRTVDTYDEFALYAASRLYVRLKNPKQFELNESGVSKLPQIKSVLNYAKTIIYPYKVDFEQETYSPLAEDITTLYENNFDFSDYLTDDCKVFSHIDFVMSLENVTSVVRSYLTRIPKRINSPEWYNIYLSCLLTILNSIVPSRAQIHAVGASKGIERLNKLYDLLKDKAPILYHLDVSYTNIIKTLVTEIKHLLTKELTTELYTYIPTETTLKNMLIPDMEEPTD